MAEAVEQLKEDLGKAVRGLAEAKAKLEATEQRLVTLGTGEEQRATELKKIQDEVAKLSKEHDEITLRLQDPNGNLPGVNPADVRGREVAARAWGKFLRNVATPGEDLSKGMNAEEKLHVLTIKEMAQDLQRRSIYVSNDELGGFLVNPVITQRMLEKLVQVSPLRQYATVMGIGSGQEAVMFREIGTLTANWTAERGTRTDGTPAALWKREQIATHEQSCLVPLSHQMVEDTLFNIEGWVESRANKQFMRGEGIAFLTGDGNGKPEGLMVNAEATVRDATAGSGAGGFTSDDLEDLFTSLESEYAMNATLLESRTTVGYMRKFKDKQDRPLNIVQLDALAALSKQRKLVVEGYPLAEMPAMASTGTASAKVAAFGDIAEAYTIVDRAVMTVIRDIYTQKASGMIELLFMRRVGGKVVQPAAYKVLRGSAS